jgi:S-DNA-T family DNA segregation ATPase FtsK/SpoIIIE
MHIALPRLDGRQSLEGLTEAQQKAIAECAAGHNGSAAPALRILPDLVTVADLQAAVAAVRESSDETTTTEPPPTAVPIGILESDLTPATVDVSAGDAHFLVVGDSGSGKTSFLRSWMRGMTERHSQWDIRFMVVDYRRSLLGAVPDEYLGAQAANSDHATAYVEQLVGKLKERMPPADITSHDLRLRNWWSGPELCLVVDDYDLVSGPAGSRGPLAPLTEYVTHAAEIGFHVVIARRSGGISRALVSDPLISRLQEYGTGGLILSGDSREGGILADQRAVRRQPGRGVLVGRRHGPAVVQTVLDPALVVPAQS